MSLPHTFQCIFHSVCIPIGIYYAILLGRHAAFAKCTGAKGQDPEQTARKIGEREYRLEESEAKCPQEQQQTLPGQHSKGPRAKGATEGRGGWVYERKGGRQKQAHTHTRTRSPIGGK